METLLAGPHHDAYNTHNNVYKNPEPNLTGTSTGTRSCSGSSSIKCNNVSRPSAPSDSDPINSTLEKSIICVVLALAGGLLRYLVDKLFRCSSAKQKLLQLINVHLPF